MDSVSRVPSAPQIHPPHPGALKLAARRSSRIPRQTGRQAWTEGACAQASEGPQGDMPQRPKCRINHFAALHLYAMCLIESLCTVMLWDDC